MDQRVKPAHEIRGAENSEITSNIDPVSAERVGGASHTLGGGEVNDCAAGEAMQMLETSENRICQGQDTIVDLAMLVLPLLPSWLCRSCWSRHSAPRPILAPVAQGLRGISLPVGGAARPLKSSTATSLG